MFLVMIDPFIDINTLSRYIEAISLFRTAQDSIWNASALEGQCTIEVLEAWTAGDSLASSSIVPT